MAFNFSASSQSLFGASSQPSLFGGSNSAQTGFGFGNPNPQSQTNLFGSAPPQSTSLFGAPSSSAQTGTSLFGSAQPQSTSLFGAPSNQSAPSLFASTTQPQSLWGANSQPSFFASSQAFGPSNNSSFNLGSQPQQQQQPLPKLPKAIMEIIEQLNPAHPNSKFHAALYNIVPYTEVSRYTRPGTMDEKLWDQAVSQNPDPSRLVPVQANLFDDLLSRSQMQEKRIDDHMGVLAKVSQDLKLIETNIQTDIQTRLDTYRRRHRELARKLLRIACTVELAASKNNASGTLTASEMERKRRLDVIARALAAPGEFKDKLSDLVELAEATVLDRKMQTQVEIKDPQAASMIRTLLTDQLAGIDHLGNACEKADRDLTIMNDMLAGR